MALGLLLENLSVAIEILICVCAVDLRASTGLTARRWFENSLRSGTSGLQLCWYLR